MYFPHTCHTSVTGVICCCLLTFNNTLKNCVLYISYNISSKYTTYFQRYYAQHVTSQPSSHAASIRPLIPAASSKSMALNTDLLRSVDKIITDIINDSTLECVPSLLTYPVFRKHTPCYNHGPDAMTEASSYNSGTQTLFTRPVRYKLHVHKPYALNCRIFSNHFKYRLQECIWSELYCFECSNAKEGREFLDHLK
jgi:hypothetical protein